MSLAVAVGCGGTALVASDGGPEGASGDGWTQVGAVTDAGHDATVGSDATRPDCVSGCDAPATEAAADGSTADSTADGNRGVDAQVPDAFPDCGDFRIVPDARPHICQFSPADVACSTSADCVPFEVINCGCVRPVYGTNMTSQASCPPPPCPPFDCTGQLTGVETEDCIVVPELQQVAVACVGGRCMTYALAADR